MSATSSDPGRWRRRSISISALALAALLAAALLPVLLPLALVRDLLLRRELAWTRALVMSAWLLFCECWGLAGMFGQWLISPLLGRAGFIAATVNIQRVWTDALMAGLRRVFGMHIHIKGLDAVARGDFILLVRHTSSADPMLAMSVVPNPMRYAPHFALKRELLWDPCLDIAAQRFPNAFIRRGAGESEQLATLADELGPRSIVVIYPEGTRFSPRRLARRLERLRERNDPMLELAKRFERCLPPHLGGLATLLDRAPGTDVVFMAHTGFDGVRTVGDLFGGKLIGARVEVKLWRVSGSQIPTAALERRRWLFEHWLALDEWVGHGQDRAAEPAQRPRID